MTLVCLGSTEATQVGTFCRLQKSSWRLQRGGFDILPTFDRTKNNHKAWYGLLTMIGSGLCMGQILVVFQFLGTGVENCVKRI